MARGRRKGLTKKLVREVKYNPPAVDFAGLEDELTLEDGSGYQPDADKYDNVDLHNLSEEELEEYFDWAAEAAQKKRDSKLEHIHE